MARKQYQARPGTKQSPAQVIPAGEFKAKCLDLMNEVRERHVEYIVTKHGHPVAKLSPVNSAPPSAWGFMGGTTIVRGDIVSPDMESWDQSDDDPLLGG